MQLLEFLGGGLLRPNWFELIVTTLAMTQPFAWLLRGVRVPNLQRASLQAVQRTEQAIATLTEALRQGESVIIWPDPVGHSTL